MMPHASLCPPAVRRGFSLIEMLVIIMMLGIVLTFSATILHGGFRIERASAAAFRRIQHQHVLADQFRADVAEAAATPESWEDFDAGPECLILRMDQEHHVMYEWRNQRLNRIEHLGDRERQRAIPLEGERLAVEFIRDGRLITLRLRDSGKAGVAQVRETAAALTGGPP